MNGQIHLFHIVLFVHGGTQLRETSVVTKEKLE